MKSWLKNIVVFLWMVLFIYLANFFGIPKNNYYLFLGTPLLIGSIFLILSFFEKWDKDKNNK
ncbi:hypothetical protein LIT25_18580 [Bacillus sp. F19]|nr:hypothetical protein LIT25_18580 [Bacillus sp. F19]